MIESFNNTKANRHASKVTTQQIERKKQDKQFRQRVLDGEGEAQLLSIACSQPPEGHARWTGPRFFAGESDVHK